MSVDLTTEQIKNIDKIVMKECLKRYGFITDVCSPEDIIHNTQRLLDNMSIDLENLKIYLFGKRLPNDISILIFNSLSKPNISFIKEE